MERIQTALAKARADRANSRDGHELAGQAQAQGSGQGSNDGRDGDAKWQAIPQVELNGKLLEKNRIYTRPIGNLGAAIDVLRTRVMQQMMANNWRRLAVTSPTTGCGKTMLALNLALGIARQHESRTLLAEFDMRRPAVAANLGLTGRDIQFSRVLAGQQDFAQNAYRIGENLALSFNGKERIAEPGVLLHSSSVPRVLDEIAQDYDPDIMIFDLPPLTAADDVLALARYADAVLIVAAAGETTVKQIDACEKELAQQTNILGVVLNKCRYMEEQSSYEYY